MDELRGIVDSSASGPLSEEQRNKILSTLELLVEQIDPEFRNSEKLNKLVKDMLQASEAEPTEKTTEQSPDKKKRKGGNGRTPAVKIKGAEVVACSHQDLKRGDPCPGCKSGKVYPKAPEVIIRFKGAPPIQAIKYELERLRCNLCGQTYTAEPPKGVGKEKYDESVASILGLLIYGGGLPRYRLAGLQGKLGIPLAQSTQWEILDKAAKILKLILKELIRQAAQGEVLHSDDTSRKILKLDRPEEDTRTGVFTSGIFSTPGIGNKAPKIALFFTGTQHSGDIVPFTGRIFVMSYYIVPMNSRLPSPCTMRRQRTRRNSSRLTYKRNWPTAYPTAAATSSTISKTSLSSVIMCCPSSARSSRMRSRPRMKR